MASVTRPGPFARKPVEHLAVETGGRRGPAPRRRRPRSHRARHRRDHRYRHLRHHRRGDRRRRPVDRPVVRPGRRDVPVLGALLRRARVEHPGVRQRLHVRLRHDGRAAGLDHRLGPHPRVRRVRRGGGRRLGRLSPEPARLAVRHQPARLHLRPAGRGRHVQPALDVPRARRHGPADLRHPRERADEHRHGDRQDPHPRLLHPGRRSARSTATTSRRGRRTASAGRSTRRR